MEAYIKNSLKYTENGWLAWGPFQKTETPILALKMPNQMHF